MTGSERELETGKGVVIQKVIQEAQSGKQNRIKPGNQKQKKMFSQIKSQTWLTISLCKDQVNERGI